MEELEITLPIESEILENGMQHLREKIVKHQGIWNIHLSDVDPWPSDPHGDRKDAAEKLNLLDGSVFDKTTRKYQYSLSKKSMKFIYRKIQQSGNEILINKLNAQKAQITYL